MTITNLTPSANHSYSAGTVAYIAGSTDYTNLTDASDTTYFTLTDANAFASFPLTDALEILSVTAATVNIRCANGSSKGDFAKLESLQVFKSDGSTAITPIALQTSTITATTYNVTFSSITLDDITSWNGAVLKVKQDLGTGTGIRVYELSIDITYTPNPDRVGSGGVKLAYTSPSRYTTTYDSGSGNWTVPYDVTVVEISLWGGGGGGGSTFAGGGNRAGCGGSGGGYCRKFNHSVTPGGTVAYVIGTGGNGGTYDSSDQTAGVNSTVDGGTYTANGGGKGGQAGVASDPGGGATGGDTNTTGTTGTTNPTNIQGGAGGAGAGSVSFPGGAGGAAGASGPIASQVGFAPGGGGGGGSDTGGIAQDGADGASGKVSFSYDTLPLFTPGPNRMFRLIGTNALSSITNNAMVVPINFPAN